MFKWLKNLFTSNQDPATMVRNQLIYDYSHIEINDGQYVAIYRLRNGQGGYTPNQRIPTINPNYKNHDQKNKELDKTSSIDSV